MRTELGKKIFKLAGLFVFLFLIYAAGAHAAWQEPTQSPPGGNVNPPVWLQASTPGTAQTGNINVSGKIIAGQIDAPSVRVNGSDVCVQGGAGCGGGSLLSVLQAGADASAFSSTTPVKISQTSILAIGANAGGLVVRSNAADANAQNFAIYINPSSGPEGIYAKGQIQIAVVGDKSGTGNPPLVVQSSKMVSNLNAQFLEGSTKAEIIAAAQTGGGGYRCFFSTFSYSGGLGNKAGADAKCAKEEAGFKFGSSKLFYSRAIGGSPLQAWVNSGSTCNSWQSNSVSDIGDIVTWDNTNHRWGGSTASCNSSMALACCNFDVPACGNGFVDTGEVCDSTQSSPSGVCKSDCSGWIVDNDGDTVSSIGSGGNDCNDLDADIYPGHPGHLVPDGKDNDCNNKVDDSTQNFSNNYDPKSSDPYTLSGSSGGGRTISEDYCKWKGGDWINNTTASTPEFLRERYCDTLFSVNGHCTSYHTSVFPSDLYVNYIQCYINTVYK